ncbi:MAG: N-acetylmuramoyl-L-alanine amidase [bacterium]|nr:N-acetylmuramoyl-L-alanine amidase [bacterium]
MIARSVRTQTNKRWRPGRWLVLAAVILVVWFWPHRKAKPVVENNTVDPGSFIVFLTPGDGGDELGGVYPQNGKVQIEGKDINLAIAQATKRALEKEGIGVKLARADDQFVDAVERKQQATQAGAAVALAIYTDSYYNDPLYTGFTIIDYKNVDWPDHYKQRAALAEELDKALLDRLQLEQTASRGVFVRNSAFVIDGPTITLLVGFISNDAERARLVDEAYQWKIANAITDALVVYRDTLRWQKNPPNRLESEKTTDALHVPF